MGSRAGRERRAGRVEAPACRFGWRAPWSLVLRKETDASGQVETDPLGYDDPGAGDCADGVVIPRLTFDERLEGAEQAFF